MRRPMVPICIAVSIIIYMLIYCGLIDGKPIASEDLKGELYGRIVRAEKRSDKDYRFLLESENGSRILVSVKGSLDENDGGERLENYGDAVGRSVMIPAVPEEASPRRNPRCFDYREYLRSKEICGIASVKSYEPVYGPVYSRVLNFIWRLRASYGERMKSALGEERAGLLMGMVLGDKGELDEDVYESFQKNGTAHILAVSGIHIGILYAAVKRVFRRKRSIPASLAAVLILILYAALTASGASVVRAVFMIILHIISELGYKRYDLLSASCFCFLVSLLKNPFSLQDPGFRLSYAAIFSLAVIYPYLKNRIERAAMPRLKRAGERKKALVGAILNTVTPSLSLQLGIAPISMYSFNFISLVTIAANIPVIALAAAALPLGIALIPLSLLTDLGLFPEAVFSLAAASEGILCRLMILTNELCSLGGHSYLNCVSPPLLLIFLYYALIFFMLSEKRVVLSARKMHKRAALYALALCLAAAALWLPLRDDSEEALCCFVDVGQGDCLHVRTRGGLNILVDSGGSSDYDVGKNTLLPYLLKNGVGKLDAVFISHRHTDHYKGLCELAAEMKIERVFFYEANRLCEDEIRAELSSYAGEIVYLKAGDRLDIEKGVNMEILAPAGGDYAYYSEVLADDSRENEISLVFKLNLYGLRLMMTGDADFEGESRVLENARELGMDVRTDILKLSHHGSKYGSSEEFLEAVKPLAAVVQVGRRNVYGHPTPEALSRAAAVTPNIYRNDTDGAILVYIEKQGLRLRKMIEKTPAL